jgi:hypothetical protein
MATMDEKPTYLIRIRRFGTLRPAKDGEVRGIDAHRADYPKCNGTQVRDDDQMLWGAPYLWCWDCEDRVGSVEISSRFSQGSTA